MKSSGTKKTDTKATINKPIKLKQWEKLGMTWCYDG